MTKAKKEKDWEGWWNGDVKSIPRATNAMNYQPGFHSAPDAQTNLELKYSENDAAPVLPVGNKCFDVEIWYLEEIIEEINTRYRGESTDASDRYILDELRNRFFRGNSPDDMLQAIDNDFYQLGVDLIEVQHKHHIFEEDRPRTFLVFLPGIHEI
jgi:hypothetical protein